MIKVLANAFRALHNIIGVSAPPPGASDRTFVLVWLAWIVFIAAFFVSMIFYIIPFLYFRNSAR